MRATHFLALCLIGSLTGTAALAKDGPSREEYLDRKGDRSARRNRKVK